MKQTVETYEQGTGKLLSTSEVEVPDIEPVINLEAEIELLKVRINKLEGKAIVS